MDSLSPTNMSMALVEDDEIIAASFQGWLNEIGASVRVFHRGSDFLQQDVSAFHLVMLDWMLPDMLGDQILVKLRQERNYTGGVLFVTSRDAESDVAFVLGLGADDYLVKPPSKKILLSRVQAVHRRVNRQSFQQPTKLDMSPYGADLVQRSVTLHGELVSLTPKEFDLAIYLFRHIGQLVGREQLMYDVWGKRAILETRTIDVHISNLRRRLKLRPENGFRLSTVHSFGYRLEPVSANANE